MDKSREQFEKWMSDDGKYSLAIEKTGEDYILATTRVQWEAWQASRAAVEIELPKLTYQRTEVQAIAEHTLYKVRKTILAEGLKIKAP